MITYHKGNAAVKHEKDKPTYIVHVVNNIGVWGAGFTASLDALYPEVGKEYRSRISKWQLGNTIWIDPDSNQDLWIINLVAQNGVGTDSRKLNYAALGSCLWRLAVSLSHNELTPILQMPKIGTGLAGGKWEIIEPIIQDAIGHLDARVYSL